MLVACGRVRFEPTARDGASIDVPIDTPASVAALFEAESGTLTAPFEIASDSAAHGGAYLLDNDPQGLGGPGAATFTFEIATAATYYIWGRTFAPDASRDSFFISIDGGAKLNYDSSACVHSPSWEWSVVLVAGNCPNTTEQTFAFTAGAHTLELSSREGLSAIDRILVTSDPMFDAKD